MTPFVDSSRLYELSYAIGKNKTERISRSRIDLVLISQDLEGAQQLVEVFPRSAYPGLDHIICVSLSFSLGSGQTRDQVFFN